MSFPKFHIIGPLFLILTSFQLIHSEKIFSQTRYDFDFDSEWNWEELIDKVVLINPTLIKSVDYLKKKISIEDARIIFKELSKLDSLKDILKLSKHVKYSSPEEKLKWDSLFNQSLDSLLPVEDFSGLISTALILAELKAISSKGLFEFNQRTYLPQPIKESAKNFKINFDCSLAEKILKYFDGDTTFQNEIFNAETNISFVDEKPLSQITRDDLRYFLQQSFEDNTLYSVYKWVNPESFWNLGGVSIYRKNFANVINSIKQNESNIKHNIEKHISDYLPGNININVDVIFSFGKKYYDLQVEKNELTVNLEYFGDDYDYLIRFIIYQIFKIVQKEIRLPIEELIVDINNRKLINLLSNVFENGTANYISPVAAETRPWYLLEKDFRLFNKTLNYIFQKNNYKADSLINIGYSGDAPFYTMATQIAYIIETTLGRNALVEAIKLGPVAFFKKYIQAYKEYPDKIRNVFTFNKNFEKRIGSLKVLFPENILREALDLKKFRTDTTILNEKIKKFIDKNIKTENIDLVYLLSGQLLLEANEFVNAKNLYMMGIRNKKDKGLLSGKIGQTFFRKNALEQSLDFFNFYVETSSNEANAYVLRGEYFYKIGEYEKAKSDFEKAIVLDSNSNQAKIFLLKLETMD